MLSKKRNKVKLNYELFASALEICLTNPSMINSSDLSYKIFPSCREIFINERLSIVYWYRDNEKTNTLCAGVYNDNVKMVNYLFMRWNWISEYTIESEEIIHNISEQFVNDLNTFSKEVVNYYNKVQKEI